MIGCTWECHQRTCGSLIRLTLHGTPYGGKATQISLAGWPFHPGWSSDGSRVFFRWEYGGIASVPAEGGSVEVVPIRSDPRIVEVLPGGGNHFSPDGSTLLFTAYKEGTDPPEASLWTVSVDGGESRNVEVSFPGKPCYREIRHSCWAPDGLIGFLCSSGESEEDWTHNIYLVSASGGEARQLTDRQDQVAWTDFNFSPDGKWLAYFSTEKVIKLLSLVGAGNRVVTSVESTRFHKELCWSPDSRQIAYSEGNRIMVTPVDGGGPHEVETSVLTEEVRFVHLDWSPDGKNFLYRRTRNETRILVYRELLPLTSVGRSGPPVIH